MTPADLPCKDGWRWIDYGGEYWCAPVRHGVNDAVAVLASRRLVLLPLWRGADLSTPAEVQSYYLARPHVPCPFVFEAP